MLKQITWPTYFYLVIFFTVLYYLIVFIIYYIPYIRQGLDELLTKGSFGKTNTHKTESATTLTSSIEIESEKPLFTLTQRLIGELEIVIRKACLDKYAKESLTTSIQHIISGYPSLKGTPFTVSVNNYITAESQINCSITISEDDLEMLWQVA